MPDVRADQLARGDEVRANGVVYTVERAKVKGKKVLLALSSRRGSFEGEVKAKAVYNRLDARPSPRGRPGDTVQRDRMDARRRPGALHDSSGAQTRWATMADLTEPADPRATTEWTAIPVEERAAIEELGAKLLGVEVEGGKLVVPPVTDGTVLAHLLTMHGVRFDGASFDEAKVWAKTHPGGTETAADVLDALTMESAYALHDRLHAGNDLLAMPTPHWHRDRAPA